MSSFTIRPMNTGAIVVDKGQYVTRGIDVGKEIEIPSLAWYLTDGEMQILVDTGMCETELADWHHRGSHQEPGEAIHERLAAIGVDAASIDMIIFTHLHWDHCHNMDRFPGARLVVSERELNFARDPLPLYDKSYEHPRTGHTPPFQGCEFETIDGNTEILPGLEMFPTPGHSPGHYSLAVQTAGGTYVIAGDAVFAGVNLQPAGEHLKFTLMGRVMDVVAAWESIEAIVDRADVVLPGHDDDVMDQAVYP